MHPTWLHVQTPLEIGGGVHALMADAPQASDTVPMDSVLNAPMQALVTEAMNTLGFSEGEITMLIADMPNAPPSGSPVVIVAQAASQSTAVQREQVLGICDVVSLPGSGQVELFPKGYANDYFKLEGNNTDVIDFATVTVEVIQQPKHGALKPDSGGDWRRPIYLPNDGYIGDDTFVVQVEGNGYKVKLHYFVYITDSAGETTNPNPVCKGEQGRSYWKISISPNGNSVLTAIAPPILATPDALTTDPLSDWLTLAQQEGKVADMPGMSVTFADLPAGSVGQTQDHTITLDTNAAGYNWFVDITPGSNDEFLPTADSNIWKAKPGSAAEGKMDLLSVLLHEYGHALGLDHSADGRDYMATTLQPGERRLPTAEEMAQLSALASALDNPTPDTPMPGLPLGTGLSALLVGRLRKSAFGSDTTAFSSVQLPVYVPQYEVVANATLTNPEFAGNNGWNTTGAVTFGNNAAVLAESAVAQTRLNQLFVLGEHDRFLRFTLDGITLDDVNGSPDDAFEVALIDANTGLSLLGGVGLTRSDALLNLQANGVERVATQVTSTVNPDGSRTYVVDLSGIAPGTVASLSFDLIGFGRNEAASNSRVTVRDLKLGIPQTYDDAVTSAEDTPATIAALANDLDADQPGFIPVIVTGAVHGQVTVNADGTFGYTPEQNWSGEDSFSYKLTDSRVDSNIATVTVTVTAVNDAPVAADAQVATLEEQALVIDLRNNVMDVDSDVTTFTGQIITGPANGVLSVNASSTDSEQAFSAYTYTPNAGFNGVDYSCRVHSMHQES